MLWLFAVLSLTALERSNHAYAKSGSGAPICTVTSVMNDVQLHVSTARLTQNGMLFSLLHRIRR